MYIRRIVQRTLAFLTAAAALVACGDSSGPGRPPRAYWMGFSAIPPRNDPAILIPAINNWALHADAAIMHVSPPWAAMIGGYSPADAVDTVEVPLANYYRGKHLAIVFTVDATDGLNRAAEAPELVTLGRSVTDSAVQRSIGSGCTPSRRRSSPSIWGSWPKRT